MAHSYSRDSLIDLGRKHWKEHLPEKYRALTAAGTAIAPEDAQLSIANLCAASDNIVFSSTPSDFVEPTHVNVQPETFWVRAFADQGFERDEDFDGSFIVEWAMRFHRA